MRIILSLFLVLLTFTEAQAYSLKQKEPIRAYTCKACGALSHESLSTHWAISTTPGKGLQKFMKRSRKYKITATYKQLREEGVPISTDAEGAIVRISPVKPQKGNHRPEFRIRNKRGMNMRLLDASTLYSENEALKETSFAGNTLVLSELKTDVGHEFTISSDPSPDPEIKDDTLYSINIFDRNSAIVLSVETNKARYYFGDELKVKIRLHDDDQNYPIEDLKLTLLDAAEKKVPITFKTVDSNVIEATAKLNSSEVGRGDNWYILIQTYSKINKSAIRRRAHVSFSYAIPSAAVQDIIETNHDDLSFSATVDAATDSRYALVAVLYAKDEQNNIAAVQTVQTAEWLNKGINVLNFAFNRELKTKYKEPFYLGYIRLIDYGQLKPVFEHDTPIELTQLARA